MRDKDERHAIAMLLFYAAVTSRLQRHAEHAPYCRSRHYCLCAFAITRRARRCRRRAMPCPRACCHTCARQREKIRRLMRADTVRKDAAARHYTPARQMSAAANRRARRDAQHCRPAADMSARSEESRYYAPYGGGVVVCAMPLFTRAARLCRCR